MSETTPASIRIGISACLLGEKDLNDIMYRNFGLRG